MGFFNSIKKMVLKKSLDGDFREDSQKIDTTELGVLTKAVNLTLDNYRKSIDKISTKVSSTEYENDFYNYNMNIKKIDNIEIDIKEINGQIKRVYDKNKELEESIKLLTQEILESQVQLDKLREEENNLRSKTSSNKLNNEENEDVREDIFNVVESTKGLEEKIINFKVKVDVSTMDI
ncbi:tetratricopeptide repeat protein, partial [Clostridium botulinum C/D]|nr:tetratricopeptide repeat protein [Clostridium botulinum C/D]